ncbi:hypothetical protein EJB05_33468, partial [Eragrostis curvula]
MRVSARRENQSLAQYGLRDEAVHGVQSLQLRLDRPRRAGAEDVTDEPVHLSEAQIIRRQREMDCLLLMQQGIGEPDFFITAARHRRRERSVVGWQARPSHGARCSSPVRGALQRRAGGLKDGGAARVRRRQRGGEAYLVDLEEVLLGVASDLRRRLGAHELLDRLPVAAEDE